MSSQQGVGATAGSSNGPPVRALDLLLGDSFDHQSFVKSEFRRAKVQLALISEIMAEVNQIPVEQVEEKDADEGDSEDEDEDLPDAVEHEGGSSDGDEDYDPNDE